MLDKLKEQLLPSYIDFLHANRFLLTAIFALWFVFIIHSALQLQLNTNSSAFYNDDDPVVLFNEKVDSAFDSRESLSLFTRLDKFSESSSRAKSIYEPQVTDYLEQLKEQLELKSYIDSVSSPLDSQRLYGEDARVALTLIYMDTGKTDSYLHEKTDDLHKLLEDNPPPAGVKTTLGGGPIVRTTIGKYMIKDLITTGVYTFLAILILVRILMKDNFIAILTLLLSGLTVFSILGTMAIVGIELSFATTLIASLTLGLGVDYALHLLNAIKNAGSTSKNSIYEAFIHTGPNLTMSFITTTIGFLSLLFGGSKVMADLGLASTIGIFFVFFYNFSLLPVLAMAFRPKFDEQKRGSFFEGSSLHRLTDSISEVFYSLPNRLPNTAKLTASRPFHTFFAILLFAFVMIYGMNFIKTSLNMSDFLPPDDPVIKDMNEQMDSFPQSANSYTVIAMADDVLDPEVLKKIDRFQKDISTIEFVQGSHSIVDDLKKEHGGALQDYRPNYEKLPNTVSDDLSMTRISIQYDQGAERDEDTELDFIAQIDEMMPEDFQFYGQAALAVQSRKTRDSGQLATTLFSFSLIFVVLSFYFKSILRSFVVLFPVFLAIVSTQGLNGWTGVPFSQITSAAFGMMIGIGIDFSIHTMSHMLERIDKGKSYLDAAVHTYQGLGKVLFATSVTTVAGFLFLYLADLSFIRDMGLTLAFGVIFSFIYSVFMLPPFIIVEDILAKRVKSYIDAR